MKKHIKISMFLVIIIVSILGIYGCGLCGDGTFHDCKYAIKDASGQLYFTNKITPAYNCIKFVDETSSDKNPITICGYYIMEENKEYKPNKK